MPTSPSSRISARPSPPPQRSLTGPLIAIAVLALAAVAVAALPASLVVHGLPPALHAEDFSGTLWHGSAGHLRWQGRDAGGIEWRLQPTALLRLTLAAKVHWVRGGFVVDGAVELTRHRLAARNIHGNGPIDDLQPLGLPAGVHGSCELSLEQLELTLPTSAAADDGPVLTALVGELHVADLALARLANGADLGGYALHLADRKLTADVPASGALTDTGGPVELRASVTFSPTTHAGLLSGTVRERRDATPALRSELEQLTQLHVRDADGRIPVDVEFTL